MNDSHTTNYSPAFTVLMHISIRKSTLIYIMFHLKSNKEEPFHTPNVQAINKGIMHDNKRATVLL